MKPRPPQTSCPVCTFAPKSKAEHCATPACTWHKCPNCKATWDRLTGHVLTIGPDASKKG